MGLAASQARLLMYTARKADCELRISKNSTAKMALAREQSKLTQEYYSKLNSKNLAYYANGDFHKLDYTYLMGKRGYSAYANNENYVKKQNLNMILTDSNGLVVLSNEYASVFKECGLTEGKPFSANSDAFTTVLSLLTDSRVDKYTIRKLLDNHEVIRQGQQNGKTVIGTEIPTKKDLITTDDCWAAVQYWYAIVLAAATNGWTSKYANELDKSSVAYGGDDYIGDGIQSGLFNLALVDVDGTYKPDATLSFFITTNEGIVENSNKEAKEKLTAWFNAEHDRISEKENYLDLEITDLSTELESIKTAIQSIESYTQDAITSIFDWGSG